MKRLIIAVTILSAASMPAFAQNQGGNGGGNGGNYRGAPGPIAGAGLPALAIGYGLYWLVKRRRKKTDV
jgi:hypothetical protein